MNKVQFDNSKMTISLTPEENDWIFLAYKIASKEAHEELDMMQREIPFLQAEGLNRRDWCWSMLAFATMIQHEGKDILPSQAPQHWRLIDRIVFLRKMGAPSELFTENLRPTFFDSPEEFSLLESSVHNHFLSEIETIYANIEEFVLADESRLEEITNLKEIIVFEDAKLDELSSMEKVMVYLAAQKLEEVMLIEASKRMVLDETTLEKLIAQIGNIIKRPKR